MATIGNTISNRLFGRTLDGTSDSDTILGHGGNDIIYGGAGDDKMYGGAGDDVFYAHARGVNTIFEWGTDWYSGGSGNDHFYLGLSSGGNRVFGDSGNDRINGGVDHDELFGGSDDDTINGDDGADYIEGNSGRDYLVGGKGSDTLYGGTGADRVNGGSGDDYVSGGRIETDEDLAGDWLTGGSGIDTFDFTYQGLIWELTDTVLDFTRTDYIDVKWVGTAANYHERQIAGSGWDAAKAYAAAIIDEDTWNVFVTDGEDGYLFTDNSGDDVIDAGIELRGLTNVSQFSYYDLT